MCRAIDWPELIRRLTEETSLKQAGLAELLGTSGASISRIRSEMTAPPKEWDQAIEMLDLYFGNFEPSSIPRVGDYHPKM